MSLIKNTSKTALGAMIAALSVALMLSTAVLPFLSYALPAVAGALLMILVIECEKRWSIVVYVTVSLLSLIIVPDKSAGIAYVLFFGYYPILKSILESKLSLIVERTIKLVLFNALILGGYYISLRFIGIDTSGIEFLEPFLKKWYIIPIIIVFASVFFIMYDIVLTRLVIIYNNKWRKKFKKLFK